MSPAGARPTNKKNCALIKKIKFPDLSALIEYFVIKTWWKNFFPSLKK